MVASCASFYFFLMDFLPQFSFCSSIRSKSTARERELLRKFSICYFKVYFILCMIWYVNNWYTAYEYIQRQSHSTIYVLLCCVHTCGFWGVLILYVHCRCCCAILLLQHSTDACIKWCFIDLWVNFKLNIWPIKFIIIPNKLDTLTPFHLTLVPFLVSTPIDTFDHFAS